MPETEQDLPESEADFGMSSPESWASWDRNTLSWRTSALSLLEDSMLFSGRWPTSGTMQNGRMYPRDPWVRPISATASSSWPTPVATDARQMPPRNGVPQHILDSPTPVSGRNVSLQHAVLMWPTPCARDYKGKSGAGRQAKRGNPEDTLPNAVAQVEDGNGILNPTWVEWLMGFPLGWSELPPSETP